MEKHLKDHSLEVFLTRIQVEKHLKDLSLEVSLKRTQMEKHLKNHSFEVFFNEEPSGEAPEGPLT